MAAVIEAHAENRVARCDQREIGSGVGLRTRMRLHVGVVGAEELLGAIDGELFRDVDEFTAAVIALARITLGVLVGEHRTLSFEHARADVVFRCDQLDVIFLALPLAVECGIQLGIESTHSHRGTEHVSGLGRVATGGANCSGWSGSQGQGLSGLRPPVAYLQPFPGESVPDHDYSKQSLDDPGPRLREIDAVVAAAAGPQHAPMA